MSDDRKARKLVLCFDGTGNKFHGDDSDSNILKIFRMLDRTADDQYHYYQRIYSFFPSFLSPPLLTNSWYWHLRRVGKPFAHVGRGARALGRHQGQG